MLRQLDGWECATHYRAALERIEDEIPTVVLVDEDGESFLVSHPLTPPLAQVLLGRNGQRRREWLILMIIAYGALVAAREEECDD